MGEEYYVGQSVELLTNYYHRHSIWMDKEALRFAPGSLGVVTQLIEDNPTHIYVDVGDPHYDYIFKLTEIQPRRTLK